MTITQAVILNIQITFTKNSYMPYPLISRRKIKKLCLWTKHLYFSVSFDVLLKPYFYINKVHTQCFYFKHSTLIFMLDITVKKCCRQNDAI